MKLKPISKSAKAVLLVLASAILAGAIGGISYYAGLRKGQSEDSTCQTCPTTVSESGVAVKCAYKANAADAYGSYEITYTVTPAIYTDQIMAKLGYSGGTDVPASVATLDHDVAGQKVTIHCKSVFTQQIVVTIYAASNTNVKATIAFDFTEKLTVTLPDSIAISEGQVPSITPSISTTGGTKEADKTPRNVNYKWNSSFIDWVKSQTNAEIVVEEDANAATQTFGNSTIGDLVGLSDADATRFFQTGFSANSFLTSKGCNYSYEWIDSDDDSGIYSTYENIWYLGSATHAAFLAEFDGTKPVFDWSCTINGKSYSKSFGLTLEAIPVTGITADTTGYSF